MLGSEFMNAVVESCRAGGKILICGNGGLAAESEHFAAEMMGKFGSPFPVPCISLTTNSSLLTALANDFGYEDVFAYQVDGLGRAGDTFIGMTTSKSVNVLKALGVATKKSMTTCILCARDGRFDADYVFNTKAEDVAAVQEEILGLLHFLAYNIKRGMGLLGRNQN